jgi:hypothetical protein
VLLLRRLGPAGPRGAAVAMFGHTGLCMLICRNEYFIRAHIYALTSILIHGLLDLIRDHRVSFPLLSQESDLPTLCA